MDDTDMNIKKMCGLEWICGLVIYCGYHGVEIMIMKMIIKLW